MFEYFASDSSDSDDDDKYQTVFKPKQANTPQPVPVTVRVRRPHGTAAQRTLGCRSILVASSQPSPARSLRTRVNGKALTASGVEATRPTSGAEGTQSESGSTEAYGASSDEKEPHSADSRESAPKAASQSKFVKGSISARPDAKIRDVQNFDEGEHLSLSSASPSPDYSRTAFSVADVPAPIPAAGMPPSEQSLTGGPGAELQRAGSPDTKSEASLAPGTTRAPARVKPHFQSILDRIGEQASGDVSDEGAYTSDDASSEPRLSQMARTAPATNVERPRYAPPSSSSEPESGDERNIATAVVPPVIASSIPPLARTVVNPIAASASTCERENESEAAPDEARIGSTPHSPSTISAIRQAPPGTHSGALDASDSLTSPSRPVSESRSALEGGMSEMHDGNHVSQVNLQDRSARPIGRNSNVISDSESQDVRTVLRIPPQVIVSVPALSFAGHPNREQVSNAAAQLPQLDIVAEPYRVQALTSDPVDLSDSVGTGLEQLPSVEASVSVGRVSRETPAAPQIVGVAEAGLEKSPAMLSALPEILNTPSGSGPATSTGTLDTGGASRAKQDVDGDEVFSGKLVGHLPDDPAECRAPLIYALRAGSDASAGEVAESATDHSIVQDTAAAHSVVRSAKSHPSLLNGRASEAASSISITIYAKEVDGDKHVLHHKNSGRKLPTPLSQLSSMESPDKERFSSTDCFSPIGESDIIRASDSALVVSSDSMQALNVEAVLSQADGRTSPVNATEEPTVPANDAAVLDTTPCSTPSGDVAPTAAAGMEVLLSQDSFVPSSSSITSQELLESIENCLQSTQPCPTQNRKQELTKQRSSDQLEPLLDESNDIAIHMKDTFASETADGEQQSTAEYILDTLCEITHEEAGEPVRAIESASSLPAHSISNRADEQHPAPAGPLATAHVLHASSQSLTEVPTGMAVAEPSVVLQASTGVSETETDSSSAICAKASQDPMSLPEAEEEEARAVSTIEGLYSDLDDLSAGLNGPVRRPDSTTREVAAGDQFIDDAIGEGDSGLASTSRDGLADQAISAVSAPQTRISEIGTSPPPILTGFDTNSQIEKLASQQLSLSPVQEQTARHRRASDSSQSTTGEGGVSFQEHSQLSQVRYDAEIPDASPLASGNQSGAPLCQASIGSRLIPRAEVEIEKTLLNRAKIPLFAPKIQSPIDSQATQDGEDEARQEDMGGDEAEEDDLSRALLRNRGLSTSTVDSPPGNAYVLQTSPEPETKASGDGPKTRAEKRGRPQPVYPSSNVRTGSLVRDVSASAPSQTSVSHSQRSLPSTQAMFRTKISSMPTRPHATNDIPKFGIEPVSACKKSPPHAQGKATQSNAGQRQIPPARPTGFVPRPLSALSSARPVRSSSRFSFTSATVNVPSGAVKPPQRSEESDEDESTSSADSEQDNSEDSQSQIAIGQRAGTGNRNVGTKTKRGSLKAFASQR